MQPFRVKSEAINGIYRFMDSTGNDIKWAKLQVLLILKYIYLSTVNKRHYNVIKTYFNGAMRLLCIMHEHNIVL